MYAGGGSFDGVVKAFMPGRSGRRVGGAELLMGLLTAFNCRWLFIFLAVEFDGDVLESLRLSFLLMLLNTSMFLFDSEEFVRREECPAGVG